MVKSRKVNKEIVAVPSAGITSPPEHSGAVVPSILHMGVGNFHRSHQAFIYQRLRELDPDRYDQWRIQGVCFLPPDLMLLEKLRAQDCLYHLKMGAPDGKDEVYLIDSIHSVLHVDMPEDYQAILEAIASPHTKIISFTITEGGYNIDFDTYTFNFDNPAISAELQNTAKLKTVFGILAKGLAMRKANDAGPITLLSCDNILKNGRALQFALKSFVGVFDPEMLEWIDTAVKFPNSMVDRITPATTETDRRDFEDRFGLKDDCLVVSESYFQWVIEADKESVLYPLVQVGVEFVEDVHPYEEMKLSILNGGHTLVGLSGDALGYQLINESVKDDRISNLYDRYVFEEVIPALHKITKIDYEQYFQTVKSRFANQMIRDSNARIISGSSDKVPKFILAVMNRHLEGGKGRVRIGAFAIALWWFYLHRQFLENAMTDVIDNLKEVWLDIFKNTDRSIMDFISYRPVFSAIAKEPEFANLYKAFAVQLLLQNPQKVMDQFKK